MQATQSLNIQNSLFQFVTVVNTANVKDLLWEQYQKFAIKSIQKATKSLQKSLIIIPCLTVEQANEEKKFLDKCFNKINPYKEILLKIEDDDFNALKTHIILFLDTLNHVYTQLDKSVNQADNVRANFHTRVIHKKNPAIAKYLID